jgi:quercetin dioxygenase-like cupin family protein
MISANGELTAMSYDDVSSPCCDMRDKVFAIEREMKKFPIFPADENQFYQVNLPVKYYHGGGVFTGELFIPKGSVVVGKIHKYENINVMTKGKMRVLAGDEIKIVEAPFVVVSPPGTKRIAYALEDTIWMTFHATDEIDPNEVEKVFIAQTEQEFLEHVNSKQLELELCG